MQKFKDLAPILTARKVSTKLRGRVYASGVRSCLLYGAETWAMTQELERRLERTEMRMLRWMDGKAKGEMRTSNKEVLERFGVEPVKIVMTTNRLRWFGHVERKEEGDWVRKCLSMEVDGTRPRGRPQKTWYDNVLQDMKKVGLKRADAQDRGVWRRRVLGKDGVPGFTQNTKI